MKHGTRALALGAAVVGIACGNTIDRGPSASTDSDTSNFDFTTSTTGGTTFEVPDETEGPQTEGPPPELTSGCAEVEVVVEPTTPTVVLLVDRSGSMTEDFGGQPRWDATYQTLMDPNDGVVAELESSVRFGLALYTSEDGFEGGECPMVSTVAPSLDNRASIDAVFGPADPIDETPTGESLALVAQQLAAFDEEGPKAIVLATDGEPDTCAQPNPQQGQPQAIAAAQEAYALGIRTHIISVGNDVGAEHLQQMANVGVGLPVDAAMPAPYYQALDAAQLVEAFEDIIGSFVSCQLAIDGEVDLNRACDGTVTLDGVELECGTDWQLPDESTLELMGDACATLQDGNDHGVDASWPCGAVQVP